MLDVFLPPVTLRQTPETDRCGYRLQRLGIGPSSAACDDLRVSQSPAPSTVPVLVRDAVLDDVPALTEIYNHYIRTTAVTFDLEPWTVEARTEWFHHYAPTGPHRLLVAVDGERVVGYASSSPFAVKAAYATTVETSVYLAPDATGSGIGTALYGRLFADLEGEDLHRAHAGITLPNPGSVALHRRFGFTEVGVYTEVGRKFGTYHDVLRVHRPLHDGRGSAA